MEEREEGNERAQSSREGRCEGGESCCIFFFHFQNDRAQGGGSATDRSMLRAGAVPKERVERVRRIDDEARARAEKHAVTPKSVKDVSEAEGQEFMQHGLAQAEQEEPDGKPLWPL